MIDSSFIEYTAVERAGPQQYTAMERSLGAQQLQNCSPQQYTAVECALHSSILLWSMHSTAVYCCGARTPQQYTTVDFPNINNV
eukprot:245535-Lingulodinium_polyedra.AAC.1